MSSALNPNRPWNSHEASMIGFDAIAISKPVCVLISKKIKLIKGISSTIIRNRMVKNKNWQSLVPMEIAEYIKKIKGVERINGIKNLF